MSEDVRWNQRFDNYTKALQTLRQAKELADQRELSDLENDWNIKLLCSGNKDNVLRALNSFDWKRFNRKRICFFIDRDLSEFTSDTKNSDENLYITDGYLIENSIVTNRSFLRVMKEIYGFFKLNEVEENRLLEDFDNNILLFQQEMATIMAHNYSLEEKRLKS